MKTLLTFLAVTLLNGAFLYPLFMGGAGRPVLWWLVTAMAAAGIGCIYLLVRYRRQL
jgi:Flp pilus assembly protein TadB